MLYRTLSNMDWSVIHVIPYLVQHGVVSHVNLTKSRLKIMIFTPWCPCYRSHGVTHYSSVITYLRHIVTMVTMMTYDIPEAIVTMTTSDIPEAIVTMVTMTTSDIPEAIVTMMNCYIPEGTVTRAPRLSSHT